MSTTGYIETLETDLKAMTTAATMYREQGDALRERLQETVDALRGLYAMLPRYSCKADALDGCPVCVAKVILDANEWMQERAPQPETIHEMGGEWVAREDYDALDRQFQGAVDLLRWTLIYVPRERSMKGSVYAENFARATALSERGSTA